LLFAQFRLTNPRSSFAFIIRLHFTHTPLTIPQSEERTRTANKWHQNFPVQCRSLFRSLVGWSFEFSVGFSALLLSLVVIVAMAEIDASSVDTNEFSRHMVANSAETFEQYGYCNSLEKEEAFECFRDLAAMVSEKMQENAILVRKNTELVSKDAALVNENTVMASTIAKLQSSVETRCTDQHPLLEPMDIVNQLSDGAFPYCDALSISFTTLNKFSATSHLCRRASFGSVPRSI